MNRRNFLHSVIGLAAVSTFACAATEAPTPMKITDFTPLKKSKDEWKKLLPSDSYAVLFEEDTERPNSSALNSEHRKGEFVCAACYLPLFDASKKFDSGTGWPSFWKALDNAVEISSDTSLGMSRDECHCRRCGGHLGHVFHDVPDQPENNRYCMDGLALKFVPKAA